MEITIHPKALEWLEKRGTRSLVICKSCGGNCCGGAMELVAQEGRPERKKNLIEIELHHLTIFIPKTISERAERLEIYKRGFSIFTDLAVRGYNPLL